MGGKPDHDGWHCLPNNQSISSRPTHSFLSFPSVNLWDLIYSDCRYFLRACLWFPPVGCPSSICPGQQGEGNTLADEAFISNARILRNINPPTNIQITSFPISKDATILWLSFSSWSSFCREPVQEGTAGMVCSQCFPRFSKVFSRKLVAAKIFLGANPL